MLNQEFVIGKCNQTFRTFYLFYLLLFNFHFLLTNQKDTLPEDQQHEHLIESLYLNVQQLSFELSVCLQVIKLVTTFTDIVPCLFLLGATGHI